MTPENPFMRTSIELTAVLSTAQAAAGWLARLAPDDIIEITSDPLSGAVVTFTAGDKTIARAQLRQDGDRLIARILEIGPSAEQARDEWRSVAQDRTNPS
jgi:Type III flagellar switch regulator (C-ring) FliN C-term